VGTVGGKRGDRHICYISATDGHQANTYDTIKIELFNVTSNNNVINMPIEQAINQGNIVFHG